MISGSYSPVMATAISSSHACWSYDDHQALDEYAKEFLRAGLAAGERIWYVPGPRSSGIADWLGSARPPPPRSNPVRIIARQDAYTAGQVVDPDAQIAAYAAVTDAALADGFTGFRVVADVTAMVRT